MLTRANSFTWGTGDPLTSAQINHIDTELVKAIDGVGGGTYTSPNEIVIGGAGLHLRDVGHHVGAGGVVTFDAGSMLQIKGNFDSYSGSKYWGEFLFGTGGLTANVNFDSFANVTFMSGSDLMFASGAVVTSNSGTDLKGTWKFHSSATLESYCQSFFYNELRISGASGHLMVTSGAELQAYSGSTVQFDSGSSTALNGDVTVGSTASVSSHSSADWIGTYTVSGNIVMSGTGHVMSRVLSASDANHTYGINDADVIAYTSLAANRTLTIVDTGATEGAVLRIRNYSPSNYVTVSWSGGAFAAIVCPVSDTTATRYPVWLDLAYIAGAWRIDGGSRSITAT